MLKPQTNSTGRAGPQRRSRVMRFEPLDPRLLLNVDWRNPVDALDVKPDSAIVADDVLRIINRINSGLETNLPAVRPADSDFFDVNGDQEVTAQDALDVINAINDGVEADRVADTSPDHRRNRITLTVGQPQGVRTYRLKIDANFAPGATQSDGLDIYLFDPTNPGLTLLDQGQPGGPLFQLSPTGASFSTDYVLWDGEILTIALPQFIDRDTGLLRLQTVNGDTDLGNRFVVTPLSNTLDSAGIWPPFAIQSLPLTVHLSPATDPNGNNVVLKSDITIEGQTSPGASVALNGAGQGAQTTTSDATGRYQFSASITPGTHDFEIIAIDTATSRQKTVPLTVKHGDVVLDWNATMLNVVRDWNTLSNDPYPNRVVLSPPPAVARNLAMVHAAIFDAVNAVERTYQPYQVDVTAPAGTSATVAAAAAAQRVASQLYTKIDELAKFNASLTEALNAVPDGPAKEQGLAVGQQVGDGILAWRTGDGAAATVTYVPGTDPGEWQRTFPDYFPPLLPQWPNVKPFAMPTTAQFLAPPPPALESAEYAAAVDEVRRLGGFTSSERTAEQTDIALFWADGGGTFTPPGHWNQIAADVALAQETTLTQNARLFMMLNVAQADAAIASWDAKYHYNYWRPIDAIRKANLDGNDATTADPTWFPLIRTPNFPSYTSGHSTFSGAAAEVLTAVFGENVSFTSIADSHSGFRERPLADERVLTRTFNSFNEAATEAGLSRIYGGIHYIFDNTAGKAVGRAIGQLVVANFPFEA